jgi:hypothetical protein
MIQEPITVEEPSGGAEIVRELVALHARSRDFWGSFSTTEFFLPLGDAWSPADNVRHLLKSNQPVLRALRSRSGSSRPRSSTSPHRASVRRRLPIPVECGA